LPEGDGGYDAGLRPEEAVAVALPDCRLPRTGWGRLILHRALPQAGKRWTDTGQFHDERGLKNHPPGEARVVSPPPYLMALWREHVATFGTADDGRLFSTEQGRTISYTTYHRVWHETRDLALPPALTSTPPAKRPYDLRYAALSTWLGAGADPAEVAQRAGNSVEVLLSLYAKCLYDRQSAAFSIARSPRNPRPRRRPHRVRRRSGRIRAGCP
jgi:hypothetical protein